MFQRAIHNLRDGLLSLAYPQPCRVCGGAVESWRDGVVCAGCWESPSVTPLFDDKECCRKCGIPLPVSQTFVDRATPDAVRSTTEDRECGRCREAPFACARACGAYEGSLKVSLLFLKSQPHLCRRLRDIIAQSFDTARPLLAGEVVAPVPLHPARRAERGFNQAEVIASMLASRFDLAVDEELLIRSKNTERHRAGHDALDRARSVERAFAVTDGRRVREQAVLLVDDVFTTGSTASAAAAVLLAAGASRVSVFTIARVIGGNWQASESMSKQAEDS